MRVLWIIPGGDDSKILMFANRYRRELESLGVEVTIFHLESRLHPFLLLKSWLKAKELLRRHPVDIIHAQYGSITGLFSVMLGRPVVITFRGTDVNGDPSTSFFRQTLTKLMSALASGLSSHSIFVSEFLRQRHLLLSSSSILASPIDLKRFQPASRVESRKALNLPLEKKLIAFITSGDRLVKRIELAESTIKKLNEKGLNASLLKIHGIPEHEVPVWLNSCDCLIMTSTREGSPNAIREALACGLPVVSVPVGDVEEWLKKDPCSKISNDDPENLAIATEAIWQSPHVRRVSMAEISTDAYAKRIFNIYNSILNHNMKR